MEVSPVEAPKMVRPQPDYSDEKIFVDPVVDVRPVTSEKSAAIAGMSFQPGGLRRTGTNATTSEPAPAYMVNNQQPMQMQQMMPPQMQQQQPTYMYKEDGPYKGEVLPPPERQIFGLSKKTFILAVSGLGLFLVILLAIILGVTLGRSGSSDKGGHSGGALSIRPDSKLSAMNWTDPTSGVEHSAVFYQHSSNALMMSVRDSTSHAWRSINITASVMNSTKAIGLSVLPGTPLACVTNAFQQSCYYLNQDRRVSEIYNTDPALNGWIVGVFSSKIQARCAPGSRISATWQICNNCSNSILVAWEDSNGADIKLANFTTGAGGQWEQLPTIFGSATPGAGLALSAFTDFRGTGAFGTDPNALRIYTASGANLVELLHGPETNFNWQIGNFGNPVTAGLSITPSPDIASITYGEHGWDNNLVTYLGPKGELMSSVYRGAGWSTQAAMVDSAPDADANFTSLAATQAMRLYALSPDGDIHEFSTNSTNPFTWTWTGTVEA